MAVVASRKRFVSRRWLFRLIVLAVLAYGVFRFTTWPTQSYSIAFRPDEEHMVRKVIDGDTIELANGDRVRLIGVDTPEFRESGPEPFADEAYRFTRSMVEGKIVRLAFDRERLDKYRRVLAFVYIDDVLVNESIVRAGMGTAMTRFGYSSRMKKRLVAAQDSAKEASVGIWSKKNQ